MKKIFFIIISIIFASQNLALAETKKDYWDSNISFSGNTDFNLTFLPSNFSFLQVGKRPVEFKDGGLAELISDHNEKILIDLAEKNPTSQEHQTALTHFLTVKAAAKILTDPTLATAKSMEEFFSKMVALTNSNKDLLLRPLTKVQTLLLEKTVDTNYPYLDLAFIYFLMGKSEEAATTLQKGMDKFPGNADLIIPLVTMTARSIPQEPFFNSSDPRLQKIVTLLLPLQQNKTLSIDGQLVLAKTFYRQEKWQDASLVANSIAETKESNFDIFVARALCAHHLEKPVDANSWMAMALNAARDESEKKAAELILKGE